jgi:hypothetical protein
MEKTLQRWIGNKNIKKNSLSVIFGEALRRGVICREDVFHDSGINVDVQARFSRTEK